MRVGLRLSNEGLSESIVEKLLDDFFAQVKALYAIIKEILTLISRLKAQEFSHRDAAAIKKLREQKKIEFVFLDHSFNQKKRFVDMYICDVYYNLLFLLVKRVKFNQTFSYK